MPSPPIENSLPDEVVITCQADDGFAECLSQIDGTLVLSTYQGGKLALIGWDGTQTTLLLRQFDKPMGVAIDGSTLALACRHEVILFADAPALAASYDPARPDRYDAMFVPRTVYCTGDQNVHEMVFDAGNLILMATRFSCLARLSQRYNLEPFWKPRFVSELVPEDRCHLNGLAKRNGRIAFATALGETDAVGGWRDNKATGGVLIDIPANEVVLRGLCMPHSPRWHQDQLWFLNSGAGQLCRADLPSGTCEVVCELPGYARGLCFVGGYAVIALSRIRERHIFGNLPLQTKAETLRCGLAIVDLKAGAQVGMFEFTAGCHELFDVQLLPGLHRPNILNRHMPAAHEAFTTPELAYWLRPDAELQ